AVGKVLGGEIECTTIRLAVAQAGADAFQEVRLARAGGAVQDEWVGALSRLFDDVQGRRMRDTIRRPHDEVRQPAPTALAQARDTVARRVVMASAVAAGAIAGRGRRFLGRLGGVSLLLACLLKQFGIDDKTDGRR